MNNDNEGFGICPHCFTSKPFFARTCHSCNKHVGFLAQCAINTLYIMANAIALWLLWQFFTGMAGS